VFLGEGGEGKTTLAVELARWLVETHRFDQAAFVSVEQEASLHSVFSRLGRQLVSDYVARSANNDDDGRRLIEEVLVDRDTLLVIDNLESIVGTHRESTNTARPDNTSGEPMSVSPRVSELPVQSVTPSESPDDKSINPEPATDDVLAPLFDLLAELNWIGKTRMVFTTRTPLPAPFDGHHIRIDRLSEGDAVELVGNVLDRSSIEPREGDAGESESEVQALVESVHCHARSLVLLAREVSEQGVTATTAALRELMQGLHERFGDDRERSLFASVELSLRRLPPAACRLPPAACRLQLPPLAVFHGGAHGYVLAQVLGLDYENDEERDFMRHLINVGLAEPLRHDHVRLHPALAPYLSNELTAERRESAVSAAMSQLTSHLYQQQFKDAQPAAELTLLELPNLLAALEHRFAAVALDNQPHRASGRFTASRDGSQRQMTTADQEPGASSVSGKCFWAVGGAGTKTKILATG
jgi:hypothetical protein